MTKTDEVPPTLEAVARAIHAEQCEIGGCDMRQDTWHDWRDYLPEARAALRALAGAGWDRVEDGDTPVVAPAIADWLYEIAAEPTPEAQAIEAQAIEDLTEAIRFTVEYVGTHTLLPAEGWSWYDALVKYAPEKAAYLAAEPKLTVEAVLANHSLEQFHDRATLRCRCGTQFGTLWSAATHQAAMLREAGLIDE